MALTQTPISLRINNNTLDRLNDYVRAHNARRNACINQAIEEWLDKQG